MIMSNESLARLAATLDSQSMSGACHRTAVNPAQSYSLIKRTFKFLGSRVRTLLSGVPKESDQSRRR
jgi:hypothetical protein